MDSNFLNFGHVQSGRQLTKCFMLHNLSNVDQLISISFGQQEYFESEDLLECHELPFGLSKDEQIHNSAGK